MKLGHCSDPAVAMEMGQKVDTVVVYYGTWVHYYIVNLIVIM
jgi:hypothetical protein